jgi:hypothetical protein
MHGLLCRVIYCRNIDNIVNFYSSILLNLHFNQLSSNWMETRWSNSDRVDRLRLYLAGLIMIPNLLYKFQISLFIFQSVMTHTDRHRQTHTHTRARAYILLLYRYKSKTENEDDLLFSRRKVNHIVRLQMTQIMNSWRRNSNILCVANLDYFKANAKNKILFFISFSTWWAHISRVDRKGL